MIRLERRLLQPWWLSVAVPIGSLAVAFAIMAVILVASGHEVLDTYRKIVEAGFTGNGALSATLVSATPILFTGLAAAAAFRMELFNIGAEGQLYLGAVGASWIALRLGDQGVDSTPLSNDLPHPDDVPVMIENPPFEVPIEDAPTPASSARLRGHRATVSVGSIEVQEPL